MRVILITHEGVFLCPKFIKIGIKSIMNHEMIKLLGIFVFLVGAGFVFFGFTDPEKLPVALLMVPIVLVFLIGSLGSYLLMRFFGGNSVKPHRKTLSILFGLLLAMIVLFQSSGGIVVGDIIILIPIMIVGYIYISKY